MIYLFLGEDTLSKDQRIVEIKQKLLTTLEAQNFDYALLHGHKLDPAELKKALIDLPAVASKRLVVIRNIDKLTAQNQKIVLEFSALDNPAFDLVLDSDSDDLKNNFLKQLAKLAKVSHFKGRALKQNVFDMTRAMSTRRSSEALKILSNIISEGTHPLQIMGGLVWFWGKSRERLSNERFRQGLLALQEADLNIKRSRLRPEHAVEKVVVELMEVL